ncbi:hypothetical protein HDU86_006007 [Geranomyces michiganensis]|nr:hypothetical protein HDU86_006007 [Geranomyces michiganensis]
MSAAVSDDEGEDEDEERNKTDNHDTDQTSRKIEVDTPPPPVPTPVIPTLNVVPEIHIPSVDNSANDDNDGPSAFVFVVEEAS